MAGVSIGSIGWDLFANTVGFESDLGRAARITEQHTARMKKQFGQVLGALGVGISVVGINNWIGGALKAQDAADELGQKLGITTEAASRLSAQAKFTAGDAEGMGKAFLKLNQNAVAAAGGVKEQAAAFKSIGVEVKDANGHVKSADQLLLDVAGKFSKYRDSAEKTALAQKLFGKSGADMLPLINLGRDGIIELNKTFDDLGITVTSKAGVAAARFADNLDVLGLVSDGVANQIAGALAPALSDLTDKAVTFFRSDDWKATLGTIRDGTQWVVDNIDSIGRVVKLVGGLFVLHMGMNATRAIAGVGLEFVNSAKKAHELAAAAKASGASTSQSFMASVGSVGKLNAALGLVGGAVMGWQIGTYLREEFEIVERAGNYMVYGILQGWEELKRASGLLWAGIKYLAVGAIDGITEVFATMLRQIASASDIKILGKSILGNAPAEINALAASISGALDPLNDLTAETEELNKKYTENSAKNKAMLADMQDTTTATRAAGDGAKGAAVGLTVLAGAAKGTAPSVAGVAEKAAESAKRMKELAEASKKWAATLADLRGAADPMVKVYEDEASAVRELFAEKRALIALGADEATIEAELRVRLALTAEAYALQRAEIIKQQDVKGRVLSDMDQEIRLLGMSAEARHIEEMVIRATADAIAAKKPLTDTEIADLRAGIATRQQMIDTINLENQAIEENKRFWQGVGESIYSSLGKAATDVIFRFTSIKDAFKSIGRTLVNEAANIVQRMLTEFAKLAAIKFFTGQGGSLSSLFGQAASAALGGGGSMLGSSANASSGMSFGNLVSMGGTLWKGFSGAAAAFGQTGGLFSAANWAQAGSSMFGGFSSGLTSLGGMFGFGGGATAALPGIGTVAANAGGTAGFGGSFGGGVGAYGAGAQATGVGTAAATASMAIPIAGAIIAAVMANMSAYAQGWRGDFASMDMNFTGFNANAFTGGGAWASAGAGELFRGLGMSGTMSNLLSGEALWGKLFGHKKPEATGYATQYGFGPDGVTGTQSVDWKSKGGWFSSDKRGTKSAAMEAEAIAALQSFYDSLASINSQIAKATMSDAASVITSTFKTTFEKDGKTIKEQVGTLMGVQYKEVWEDFQQRVASWQAIAAVDMSSFGEATAFAQPYNTSSTSVAQIADVSSMLVAAQIDITNGAKLLGETGGGALTHVATLMKELASAGGSLSATYQKAVGSTLLMDTATALMGINLGKSREDVVRFAVGIADAAGGLEQAGSLWSNFFNRFYTDAERAQLQFSQAMESGASAFTTIGLNLNDYTGEGGASDFRKLFEDALPTLSAEATVQWLKAAAALGIVIDASAALAAAAGTVAGPIAQTADQIKAITEILDAYAWERAGDGMTQAQQAARDLDRQYQEQVRTFDENAATLEQRNQLEKEYAASVEAMNASFKKQRDAILAGNDYELSLDGMTENERQVAEINQRYAEQRASLIDLGATQEELDRLERQRLITLGNLANATAAATAAEVLRQQAAIAGVLDGNAWNLATAGMTTAQRAARDLARQYEDQHAILVDNNASLGQFITLSEQYGEQVIALHQQMRRQIEDVLGGNDRDLAYAGMTDAERQIAEINQRYADQAAGLRDLGATQEDLDRLERQRIATLGNLAIATAAANAAQVAGILGGNGWTLALAGMTDTERQIAEINRSFDQQAATLVGLNATQAELDELERQRIATLGNLAAATAAATAAEALRQQAAIAGVLDGNAWSLATAGMTTAQQASRDLAKRYEEQVATLTANGASVAQLTLLQQQYGQQTAQLNAQFREQIEGILSANDWTLQSAGMTESERKIAEVNRAFAEQAKQLRDLGASQADLDRLEKQRLITLGNLSVATAAALAAEQAQAATKYDDLARSIRSMGVTLTDYERQMQEANSWYSETTSQLHALAIQAGRSGANLSDLTAAEVELDRRRAVAMQNLMDQTQRMVTELYGTVNSREIAALEARLADRNGFIGGDSSVLDFQYYADQRRLAELKAKEAEEKARMERMAGINGLVGNLGQLLTIPGKSLEDLAKQFGLPLDMLATDLGISQDALEKYIREQADRANATLTLNDTVKDKVGISNAYLSQMVDLMKGVNPDDMKRKDAFSTADRVAIKEPIVDIGAARAGRRDDEMARKADQMAERLTNAVEKLLPLGDDQAGLLGRVVDVLEAILANSKGDYHASRIAMKRSA